MKFFSGEIHLSKTSMSVKEAHEDDEIGQLTTRLKAAGICDDDCSEDDAKCSSNEEQDELETELEVMCVICLEDITGVSIWAEILLYL